MNKITALVLIILINTIALTLVSFIDLAYGEVINASDVEGDDYYAQNVFFICDNESYGNFYIQQWDDGVIYWSLTTVYGQEYEVIDEWLYNTESINIFLNVFIPKMADRLDIC